jgi:CheY-like chemotaxis protein
MARILVMDDDPQVRIILQRLLEKNGYEVVDAPDGKEGTRLFRQQPADLVITDIFMPEKDGIEVIQELTEDFPDVRIIAISGGGKTGKLDFLPHAEALGAHLTFRKPLDLKELLDAVRTLISA